MGKPLLTLNEAIANAQKLKSNDDDIRCIAALITMTTGFYSVGMVLFIKILGISKESIYFSVPEHPGYFRCDPIILCPCVVFNYINRVKASTRYKNNPDLIQTDIKDAIAEHTPNMTLNDVETLHKRFKPN